ncbi:uncharacterized protein G2W53_041147 [Senna tora]|uniref:Uncharacterized protein n=1 Tax=Senna tora TaxID=362788 RepID=A0A834SEN2_9FABA|nr:uncharacterized protein G2W53_041147 [Senna tora]
MRDRKQEEEIFKKMQLSDSLTSIDQIVRKLEIEREEERRRVLHSYTLSGGLRRRVGPTSPESDLRTHLTRAQR